MVSCSNDVMNDIDCVMKRGVYTQKMHSCSKNIRGILFCILIMICGILRKNIS